MKENVAFFGHYNEYARCRKDYPEINLFYVYSVSDIIGSVFRYVFKLNEHSPPEVWDAFENATANGNIDYAYDPLRPTPPEKTPLF